jgi:hypothetical protein
MKYGDDIHNGEVCPVCHRGDEIERKLTVAEKYLKAIAMTTNVHPDNLQGLALEAFKEIQKINQEIHDEMAKG